MKRKIKSFAAAMALALTPSCLSMASSGADTLIIVRNGDVPTEKIALLERPAISYVTTYDGCGVLVETASGDFRALYPLGDVRMVYFIQANMDGNTTSSSLSQTLTLDFAENTGIIMAKGGKDDVVVSFTDDGYFRVRGLSGYPSVNVFSLDGRALKPDVSVTEEGEVDINLENLLRGYYIIKVNNQSYKIFKR